MSDKYLVRRLDDECEFMYLETCTVNGYERWSSDIKDAVLFANSDAAECVALAVDAGVVRV